MGNWGTNEDTYVGGIVFISGAHKYTDYPIHTYIHILHTYIHTQYVHMHLVYCTWTYLHNQCGCYRVISSLSIGQHFKSTEFHQDALNVVI